VAIITSKMSALADDTVARLAAALGALSVHSVLEAGHRPLVELDKARA